METRRLFYEDAYRRDFYGVVRECREWGDGWSVRLSQTLFYPEGGGAPADHGWLGEAKVLDVQEREGEIWHDLDKPLEVGATVEGVIDWDHRFDLMQQHSGEHLVSGLVHREYGLNNVGFHMGEDVITIDFSGILSMEQLRRVEEMANQVVARNVETEIFYPSPEGLETLEYRSKKELSGEVRIVRFPDCDTCACCGLHVKRTGEIQMVHILSVVKFREGVRVEMISGRRLLSYLWEVEEQNHLISVMLSAKMSGTAGAVERLQNENFTLRGRIRLLQEEGISAKAAQYAGKGNVLLFEEGLDADMVRKLTDAVQNTCGGRCAVFSDNGDGTFKYALGEKNGNLAAFTKAMNVALQGRGGGKPFFVQGSVKASREEIEAYFAGMQNE